jgi:hypothetical protein
MNNRYEVLEDYSIIYIKCKGIEYGVKVDTEDLERLSVHNWYGKKNEGKDIYAVSVSRDNRVQMHRLIMDAAKGDIVDHKYHDTLDNRKDKLRIVCSSINAINRKSPEGISGIRGVTWDKNGNKWRARVRNVALGQHTDKYEAGRAVNRYLLEHYDSLAVIRTPIKLYD